jgi:hypothetical protein
MYKPVSIWVIPILAGLLSFAWSASYKSQSTPLSDETLSLDFKDASSPEILTGLSEKLKQPVVLDGGCDMKASIHVSLPRSLALGPVARMLDLEVRQGRGGAVIFTQRFEGEPRLPQARPAEIGALAANVLRTLPDVRPDPDHEQWGIEVRRLAGTLDRQQRGILETGGAVDFSELNPAQRDLVTQCVYGRFVGGPRYFYTILSAVSSDPERTLVKMDPRLRTLMVEPPPRFQVARVNLGIQLPEGGKQ